MRLLHHWNQSVTAEGPTAEVPLFLVIGAFDGIHIGHQMLIQTAVDLAQQAQGEAWILTFDPHPLRVLRPDQAPPLLTSTPHKVRLLGQWPLQGAIIQPFTSAIAQLTPEAFVQELNRWLPSLHTVVVGTNWRFGHRASGDPETLANLGQRYGFTVHVPPPLPWRDQLVSSTRIRHAIEQGDLAAAAHMLGRPFSLLGTVTAGRQVGRSLGFPTANIRLQDEVRPLTGVYAVEAKVADQSYAGAAYLGIRPTASGEHSDHLLEVHFLDVALDLYGEEVEVALLERIRPDQFFDDLEALRAQIARDVESCRTYFRAHHPTLVC